MTDNNTKATSTNGQKWAAELNIAIKELLQSEDEAKRTADLVIAIKELLSQNEEKAKRAVDLVNSTKELLSQNEEKAKRAANQVTANNDLINALWRLKAIEAERRTSTSSSEPKTDPAVTEVQVPTGLLPTCSWCKKIRDESGSWNEIEDYITKRTGEQFTHGICPDCRDKIKSE